jgi:hypothetical protein
LTVDAAVVGLEESKAAAAVITILLLDVQIRHWFVGTDFTRTQNWRMK